MTTTTNIATLVKKCRKETDALVSALHTSEGEEQWTSLLNDIQVLLKEPKWGVLYVLKSVILSSESVAALKNLMQVYIMKMSGLTTQNNVLENESLAAEYLALLRDFWALCSNQHHALTKQMFGRYNAIFYDVLPSMASLYIDLFVASNRSKEKTEMFSKRLYGWLGMDLNERCLKAALLEVSKCTSNTATFLLPILRKILLPPPPKKSFMDYLLHFVLLRRWALVSKELADVVQVNLNVKAPKNFVDWLCQRWDQAREYVPQDKSLKGRRVSELICSLDKEAVEGLIDVFCDCLSSGGDEDSESAAPTEDGEAVTDLFVIDKSGNGQDGPPSKKRRKAEEAADVPKASKDFHSKSNGTKSAEKVDTSHSEIVRSERRKKARLMKNDNSEDSQMDADFGLGFVVDRSAAKTEQVQGAKKGKVENESEKEKSEEEEMDVDESKERESDDAGDNSDLDSDREEVDDDDDNDDDDDDDLDNGGEEDSGDDEDVGSDGEDNADNDSSINEVGDNGSEEDSENDGESDDSNEAETAGDKSKDQCVGEKDLKNSPTKPSVPNTFPSCVKDPALSYFVNTSVKKKDSKEPEIEVIDGMEIQTFESIDPEELKEDASKTGAINAGNSSSAADKTPSQLATASSNNKNSGSGRRKREASESLVQNATELESSDSTPMTLRGANLENSDTDTDKRGKRSRTESGSIASGKGSKNADETPRGAARVRKINDGDGVQQSSVKPEEKKEQAKGSATRATRLSESSVSQMQAAGVNQKSQGSRGTDEIVDDAKRKSQRLRSDSESSRSKMQTNLSPERPHSTRRSAKVSESSAHEEQGRENTLSVTEERNEEGSDRRSQSPKKKLEQPKADSPRKKVEQKAESPKKTLEVDSVDEKAMSLTEESATSLGNLEKEVTVTEEQVGLMLSQLRSSLGEDLSKTEPATKPTRSSTRLRTKSESSDVQSNTKPKTARNGRRQTLTGIKAKVDTPTSNSKNYGSAKMLSDWLRKAPGKAEEQAKNERAEPESTKTVVADKTDVDLNKDTILSSSDNEVTFKKTPKTYAGSATKRGRSPKRILVESKLEASTCTSSETDRNKSPEKVLKSDTSPSKGKRSESGLSIGDDSKVSTTSTSRKTPKSLTPGVKSKVDAESSKTSQATPQSKKTPAPSSPSKRRKYYLRGTSPVKSPTGEIIEKPLTEETTDVSTPATASDSSSVKKPARKSPAERRKSLRSSSKQQ